MLIWGDEDLLVHQEMQDELLRLLPLAEPRTYPGVGHTPRWVQPERFAVDVGDFALAALE